MHIGEQFVPEVDENCWKNSADLHVIEMFRFFSSTLQLKRNSFANGSSASIPFLNDCDRRMFSCLVLPFGESYFVIRRCPRRFDRRSRGHCRYSPGGDTDLSIQRMETTGNQGRFIRHQLDQPCNSQGFIDAPPVYEELSPAYDFPPPYTSKNIVVISKV